MAEIKPLRAWRFNVELLKNIEDLVSPLFDVVSENQRQKLYENPLNSIHLSVPNGENTTQGAARRLTDWKKNGGDQTRRIAHYLRLLSIFHFAG